LLIADVHSDPTQAKRIHERLTGVAPSADVLDDMVQELSGGNVRDDGFTGGVGAAYIAMDNKAFYSATIKNWAAPWTNRDQDVFAPFNDYIATVIGFVREDEDFRGILYRNLIGRSNDPDAPAYSTIRTLDEDDEIEDHYEYVEENDAYDTIVLEPQTTVTGLPLDAVAGVMTTHAAAKAFFIDGTNRAMFRYTLLNHMCMDLEQVQDTTRAPDRIRQDVSRSPGGDSRVFLNNCISCHSGMDPLAQAFAYYDYENPEPDGNNPTIHQIVYNDPNNANDIELDEVTGEPVMPAPGPDDEHQNIQYVQSKYYNNNTTFPAGYITPDDRWSNYWREGPNSVLGWDYLGAAGTEVVDGNGAASMGQELAHSRAFAECQVQKVFKNVCLRDPISQSDLDQLPILRGVFESSTFNMKRLFAETANYCLL
jgi:hypothetical protein